MIMKIKYTCIGIIMLWMCICVFSCRKNITAPNGVMQYALLDSVNALRSKGCNCDTTPMPPAVKLVWNNSLAQAAKAHATDMYTNNYFSHIAPDGSSPIQRAEAAGFTGQYVGENIAEGYTTIASVMLAWKNSPDHCMTMMDTLYIEMGAYSYNGYWVEDFGR